MQKRLAWVNRFCVLIIFEHNFNLHHIYTTFALKDVLNLHRYLCYNIKCKEYIQTAASESLSLLYFNDRFIPVFFYAQISIWKDWCLWLCKKILNVKVSLTFSWYHYSEPKKYVENFFKNFFQRYHFLIPLTIMMYLTDRKYFLETYQILSSFTVMIAVEKKKCSFLKVWMSNMI